MNGGYWRIIIWMSSQSHKIEDMIPRHTYPTHFISYNISSHPRTPNPVITSFQNHHSPSPLSHQHLNLLLQFLQKPIRRFPNFIRPSLQFPRLLARARGCGGSVFGGTSAHFAFCGSVYLIMKVVGFALGLLLLGLVVLVV